MPLILCWLLAVAMSEQSVQVCERHFNLACQGLGAPVEAEACEGVWRDIVRRHQEPQRHYHTLDHLCAMLLWLEGAYQQAGSSSGQGLPVPVTFAVLFHDCVYNPRAADNEEQSALVAQAALAKLGAQQGVASTVNAYILATKTHAPSNDVHTTPDQLLFLDADLAILAAGSEEYGGYCQAIRQEYCHLPDNAFQSGRAQVLTRLLDSPNLFFSPHAQQLGLEAAARANMGAELSLLTS